MQGYYIEPIIHGLVKIHEDVAAYCMNEAAIVEALEHVKSHRSSYADDATYLRRVGFYEEALKVARGSQEVQS